jgi:hypothetical protein
MLQIKSIREDLIAGIAQKYFGHVILIFPQQLDPQQFFHEFCQLNSSLQHEHPELFESDEFLLSQLQLARQNFLNSLEVLNFQIFYCNFCKKHLTPAQVASHVQRAAHIAAKDDAENAPSFGCPIVLHGRPMILDHHVVFPHSMFGSGAMMFDDTIGAVVLPDASKAVQLCPGHEYSIIRFHITAGRKHETKTAAIRTETAGENGLSERLKLPSQTRQNRYFTKDFVEGTKAGGPKDDSATKFRRVQYLARTTLELDPGEDFPDSINAAASSKAAKIRRQMELLKIQDVKNRAGKKRDDRDDTLLRFPKMNSASNSIVSRVAGVSALVSVDEQTDLVKAKEQTFRKRLVRKMARDTIQEKDKKGKKK